MVCGRRCESLDFSFSKIETLLQSILATSWLGNAFLYNLKRYRKFDVHLEDTRRQVHTGEKHLQSVELE